MLLQALGSIGLGLVTGWLSGLIFLPWSAGFKKSWPRLAALGASLLALGSIVIAWAGWRAVLLFFFAFFISFLVQHAWRKALREQAKSNRSNQSAI